MADILHLVGIEGSPEKIYTALTESNGLQGWWSQHSEVDPNVGSSMSVSFYSGMMAFEFKVTELIPGNKVVWEFENGPPDWENTTVTWTISEGEGQTMLHFAHSGFASTEGGFAGYNFNWGWYLASLKGYVEKGTGMPHTDADKLPGS